jgi:hypothetical protein
MCCGLTTGGPRRRCPLCDDLVGRLCCWTEPGAEDPKLEGPRQSCKGCRDKDRPVGRDVKAHRKRIAARRAVLDKAIAMYEKACCAFWDGDYTIEALESWGADAEGISIAEALDGLNLVIRQACEDLGTPEALIEFPRIEFPGFCDDGSVDLKPGNLAALGQTGDDVASATDETETRAWIRPRGGRPR